MNDASQIALSAEIALMRRTDIIANNIANLSTNGYKGEHLLFAEYLNRTNDGGIGSYVQPLGTVRDTSQGPLSQTGNPLDVAIEGDGYLAVQTPNGTRYTRNGHFQLDAQGEVVTSQGFPILSAGGAPIVVPNGAGAITIGQDGTVVTDQGNAGQIQIATFQNPQAMLATGNNFYSTDQAPGTPTSTKLVQGSLEQANVQPIIEITQLIATERAVSFAKDMSTTEGTRISNAIDRLGKVS
jgi:flagellar basal-body rod protein FlgF